jgi:hypothetical protein
MSMIEEKRVGSECSTCSRIAAMRVKAAAVERVSGGRPTPAFGRRSEAEKTARQLAASEWSLEIAAIMRKEMAPHPRCAACGILMGPGHIEQGSDSLCRTCQYRRTAGRAAADLPPERPAVGRRGWLSDYSVEH